LVKSQPEHSGVAFGGSLFGTNPDADFDGNSVVDFQDLGIMKSEFPRPPGPSALLARAADALGEVSRRICPGTVGIGRQ
jgi:hypothetical protein